MVDRTQIKFVLTSTRENVIVGYLETYVNLLFMYYV